MGYPGKSVTDGRFRPYEDVLGVATSAGFSTLLVPGAGYANFDSFEASPFETKKQRREREVRTLLEKLQPDSIMLDPNQIGNIDHKVVKTYVKEVEAKIAEQAGPTKKKKKMRGADKAGSKQKRKTLVKGQS